MKKKNFIKWILLIVLLFIIGVVCYRGCSFYVNVFQGLERAKVEALNTAVEELGADCKVVYGKYDFQNRFFQIGCVNSKGDHAILYIVTQSIDQKEWFVRTLASRNGGGAEALFKTPVIIHGYR